jgi:hypothetical protein
MRPEDLLKRLHDEPFKAFRIHLDDRTIIEVLEPGMVIVGESTAVLPTQYGREADGHRLVERWRTIALAHITQFSDAKESGNGRKGGRRRAS